MQASVLYQKKGQNRLKISKIWRSPQEAAFGYGHPLPVPVLVGCDGLLTVSALKVQNNSTWYEWDGILGWREAARRGTGQSASHPSSPLPSYHSRPLTIPVSQRPRSRTLHSKTHGLGSELPPSHCQTHPDAEQVFCRDPFCNAAFVRGAGMDARADCHCLKPAVLPLWPLSCAFPLSVAWAARVEFVPRLI